MRKIFKVLSIASLASILTISTGCSCKATKKTIEEVTSNLYNSALTSETEKAIDFVARYEMSEDNDMGNTTWITVVKRDVENDMFILQNSIVSTIKNNDPITLLDEDLLIYKENGKVYSKDLNIENAEPVLLLYSTPYYAYKNYISTGEMKYNYYTIIDGLYNKYKSVPYNACASNGDVNSVVDIYAPSSELLECSAKKALFKKEYTFVVGYNTSLIEWDEVTIEVNKDHMMTSLEVSKKFSDNSTENYSLTVDYSNIDLTK